MITIDLNYDTYKFTIRERYKRCKKAPNKVAAFEGAPLRKGIVYKIAVMSPRKPNSAKRTFAKVKLVINKNVYLLKFRGLVNIIYKRIRLFLCVVMGQKIHQD